MTRSMQRRYSLPPVFVMPQWYARLRPAFSYLRVFVRVAKNLEKGQRAFIDSIRYSARSRLDLNNSKANRGFGKNEIYKVTIQLRAKLNSNGKIYLNDSIADISHRTRTPLTTINLLMSF